MKYILLLSVIALMRLNVSAQVFIYVPKDTTIIDSESVVEYGRNGAPGTKYMTGVKITVEMLNDGQLGDSIPTLLYLTDGWGEANIRERLVLMDGNLLKPVARRKIHGQVQWQIEDTATWRKVLNQFPDFEMIGIKAIPLHYPPLVLRHRLLGSGLIVSRPEKLDVHWHDANWGISDSTIIKK